MSSVSPFPAAKPSAHAANPSTSTSPSPQQPYHKTTSQLPTDLPNGNSKYESDTLPSTPALESRNSSAAVTSSPRTAMISGHTDLPPKLFDAHYIPQLTTALEDGATFIVGDAKGVDEMALTWLLTHLKTDNAKRRVTVYCSRAYNVSKLEALGVNAIFDPVKRDSGGGRVKGRESGNPNASRQRHLDRDARMTAASDFDILYVRTDEEAREFYGERWRGRVSATEMNRDRRVGKIRDAGG